MISNIIETIPPTTASEVRSSTVSTSDDITDDTNHTKNQTRIRRKHNCLFCQQNVRNFSRHLERNYDDELSVQEIMILPRNSTKRKKLINKLRHDGDFCSSEIVPVLRAPDKDLSSYIVCKFCRGYYSRKSLRRHAKKCYFNPDPTKRFLAQTEGQTLMAGHFGPNDVLKTSGLLNMMRADDVSMVAKKDPIICEVARRYLRRHKEMHLLQVAKRHMRRLARIV
ncbi:hypothetical protein NQ314_002667 [Rhamnusium bicolor]|uniref:C2H2-type domain-containing protein n=1 Tax=Rhamnusium bicolor TaxID=1586634 RepID=A0AAV8ZQQ7_9CUCU|nr:hypothetical protein NQ314_002667 [Rhamnusium bicolor]